MTGKELYCIAQAHFSGRLSGDGEFTRLCSQWLAEHTGCAAALLTHSCTAALEMSALLLDIRPGDEIIMPSYTFVATATAFALRGGVPVFVDIRPDTLKIDEELIEGAITPKTRAIVVVHYAGVACEMDRIMQIAAKHGLPVVEDAAQGIMAHYRGRPLGSIGAMGTLSFHETKNIICGEGGALLVNQPELTAQAEIIRDTGTNRKSFYRGETDRYTWVGLGSSYLPGELTAAFLWAQLEEASRITQERLRLWDYYHQALQGLEAVGQIRRPIIPEGCGHNAHIYYILLAPQYERQAVLAALRKRGVGAIFHYVPLHSAPGGLKYSRTASQMQHTDDLSARLVRLPLWNGMGTAQQDYVLENLQAVLAAA